jgi:2-dehydro-3-deoxyphosphogalactonate aldolase
MENYVVNRASDFHAALARCPLVAILRGIEPEEVEAVGDILVDAGFSLIEVPLNSPRPLESIQTMSERLDGRAMVGAGTVLSVSDVENVRRAGGKLIVSPNVNTSVIRASRDAGLYSLPGFFSPSEAFAAIEAGAHALKLFPADGTSPATLKAMKAVLPRDVPVLSVGGVTPETMRGWAAAGAAGFGIGSALYKPGISLAELANRAKAFVSASAKLA